MSDDKACPGDCQEGGGDEIFLEDAVTFLERAKKVCPDVSFLLNSVQLVALDFDPNQPFSESSVSVGQVVISMLLDFC